MDPGHPKVVIIGAGSLFFGRQAIWQMVRSPHLRGGTLALVDTDAARLARMEALVSNRPERAAQAAVADAVLAAISAPTEAVTAI